MELKTIVAIGLVLFIVAGACVPVHEEIERN